MRTIIFVALGCSLGIAACGGGGDDTSSPIGDGTGTGGKSGASGASTGGSTGVAGHAGAGGAKAGASGAAGAHAGASGASAGGAKGGGAGESAAGTTGAGHAGSSGSAAAGSSGAAGQSGSAGHAGTTSTGGSAGSSNAGAGGANGGSSSGAAGSGGSGSCTTGASQACGICASGISECAAGVWGPCAYPDPVPSFDLTGTVRDFHMSTVPGGHPDFENLTGDDHGIAAPMLGADMVPVYLPGPTGTSPTTHGKMYFDEWYHDTPNVNESVQYTITLALVAGSNPPVYSYLNNSFFPIDNMLLGNDGEPHNYSFTYEMHTQFQYRGGETFTFSGDDDLFVFMNTQLAINLGGVHGAETMTVNLDDLAGPAGMSKCGTYDLDMFSAERHTVASDLGISTTLALSKPLGRRCVSPMPARCSTFPGQPRQWPLCESAQSAAWSISPLA